MTGTNPRVPVVVPGHVPPYYADDWLTILAGDCRAVMAEMEPESVQCVVTSPPYLGLRDYGIEPSVWGDWTGVLGLEPTVELYVAHMVEVFRGVRRILRPDGCLFLNLGDSYATVSAHRVRIREDVDLTTLRRIVLDMFGLRLDQPDEAGEGPLPSLLPGGVEGSPVCDRPGVASQGVEGQLSTQPSRLSGAQSQPEQADQEGRDRQPGREVCLLRGDDAGVPDGGPCQRGRSGASEGTDGEQSVQFDPDIPGDQAARLSEGPVQGPLLQLQLRNRLLGLLSTYECDEAAVPGGLRRYFRQVGLKPKDRMGVPQAVVTALRADGWFWRDEVVWHKPNPMPSSVTDRTTPAHEMVYLLTKSARYFYDADAIKEPVAREWDETNIGPANRINTGVMAGRVLGRETNPHGGLAHALPNPAGRNKRSVWTIATAPYGNFKMPVQGEHDGDDGSGRTTSPDCPVHGDLSRQDSTAGRDGQPGASGLDHTPRNGRRHEQVPLFGLAPIEQLPDADSGLDSLGSLLPECGAPATPHSTQSHRTDLAPETSPRETDAVGSSDRTGRTSPDAETDASGDHSPESRTEAGSAEGDRRPSSPAETPDRNACTCTSWVSVSHFAVFPPKLIEPMILAGSKPGDVILDPFGGSGTVGMVAQMHSRRAVLIDLNPDYLAQCLTRNAQSPLGLES